MRVRAFASWGSLLALTACSADQTTLQFFQGALSETDEGSLTDTESQSQVSLSQSSPQPEATVNRPSLTRSNSLSQSSAAVSRGTTNSLSERQPSDLLKERLDQIRAQRAKLRPLSRPGEVTVPSSPVPSIENPISEALETLPQPDQGSSPSPKPLTTPEGWRPSSPPFSVTPLSPLSARSQPAPIAAPGPTEAALPRAEPGNGVPLDSIGPVGHEARDLVQPSLAASSLPTGEKMASQPSPNLHVGRSPDVTLAPPQTNSLTFHGESGLDNRDMAISDYGSTLLSGEEPTGTSEASAPIPEHSSLTIGGESAPTAEESAPVPEEPDPASQNLAPTTDEGNINEGNISTSPAGLAASAAHSGGDRVLAAKRSPARKSPSVQLVPAEVTPRPQFSASQSGVNVEPAPLTERPSLPQTSSPQDLVSRHLQTATEATAPRPSQPAIEAGATTTQATEDLPASLPLHENRVRASESARVALQPPASALEAGLPSSPAASDSRSTFHGMAVDGWGQMSFSDTVKFHPDQVEFAPSPFPQEFTDDSDAVHLQRGNPI